MGSARGGEESKQRWNEGVLVREGVSSVIVMRSEVWDMMNGD